MDEIRGLGGPIQTPQDYRLPLMESRRESPTVMTFRFSTEGSGFHYRSNQAVRLALPGVADPWGVVRAFSLSSSPSETGFIEVTCKITDTPFKQALSRLHPGDFAQVYGPLGHFLLDASRPAVLLAGGIGITPFRGMVRFAADTGLSQPLALLYSARVPAELVFRRELDQLAVAHPQISVHYTVTRPAESKTAWEGRVGRIDADWIASLTDRSARPRYYVAGLPEMVEEMVTALSVRLQVSREDIEFESFRGY
jgi:glycine betaine catabolism B